MIKHKIILIGFMGSGKSAVAHELATHLSLPLYEMDAEILKKAGYEDMGTLFQSGGEILLREWEIRMAHTWSSLTEGVISCGGGVVSNSIVIQYLRQKGGIVFFLDAPFDVLAERISLDSVPRPLFQHKKQARDLYHFRLPLYRAYADHHIYTHASSVDTIAQTIISTLNI